MGVRSLFIYLSGIMDGSKGEVSSETPFRLSPPLPVSLISAAWLGLHKTARVTDGL